METLVGKIKSKTSHKEYSVKWDVETKDIWIERKSGIWEQVAINIASAEIALQEAQLFIDFQSGSY